MKTQEEFWARVSGDDPLGCWEWQGARNPQGYGRLQVTFDDGTKKHCAAHRVAYHIMRIEILHSRVPLDHECCNPPCVNPWHLEIVDWHTNSRLAVERGRWRNTYTHPDQVKYSPYALPHYRVVIEKLRERIRAGEWAQGAAFPLADPMNPLNGRLGLNRTQRHAVLSWLQAEGLIGGYDVPHQGKGVYVKKPE